MKYRIIFYYFETKESGKPFMKSSSKDYFILFNGNISSDFSSFSSDLFLFLFKKNDFLILFLFVLEFAPYIFQVEQNFFLDLFSCF